MIIKKRRLYVKKNGKVKIYRPRTNRIFFARIRAYLGDSYRVWVEYDNSDNAYKDKPINNSGWYTNKSELLKTARAFCEK